MDLAATAKTRVMFVDDDLSTLQWLERTLNPLRERWDMSFVESGELALNLMESTPSHVVVSDMRMPRMSGAELLARLKRDYPTTVRVIISDYADRESVVKCVGTAHQFLSKPCHPEELRVAVDRACAFNSCAKSERINRLIGQMDSLPSLPSLLTEILDRLRRDDVSLDEIGELLAQDVAMTAKLLRLVNSGFFGLQTEVTSVAEAVSYLGMETVKALMLTNHAFSTFDKQNTGPLKLDALWRHSLQVAATAQKIAADVGGGLTLVEESFLAGMLHDIGKLALAVNSPDHYRCVFNMAENLGVSLHAAEEAAFGAHHGDIGGHLLQAWALPPRVVAAIAHHHEPAAQSVDEFTPSAAVYIANGLVHETSKPGIVYLDGDFLHKLGVIKALARWRDLARS